MGMIGASVLAVVLAAQPPAPDRMDITLRVGPEVKRDTVAALAKKLQAIPATRVVFEVVPGQAATVTATVRVGDEVRWADESAVYAAFKLAGVSQITNTRPPK